MPFKYICSYTTWNSCGLTDTQHPSPSLDWQKYVQHICLILSCSGWKMGMEKSNVDIDILIQSCISQNVEPLPIFTVEWPLLYLIMILSRYQWTFLSVECFRGVFWAFQTCWWVMHAMQQMIKFCFFLFCFKKHPKILESVVYRT